MKRENKNALSRQRIIDAALREFSAKGYEGASLNTAWAENGISKGIIYHHFKNKDEIYLHCVRLCFDALTAHLRAAANGLSGSPAQRMKDYFDARARFFAEQPLYLGIFCDAAFQPATALAKAVKDCRKEFDMLNISVFTRLLAAAPLRKGLSVEAVAEDFQMYVDFFNLRFKAEWGGARIPEQALQEHEKRCYRQLDILLYGVLDERAQRSPCDAQR